ncbi:MAG TPA: acetoacetate--CoA ligase [Pusillimonas sp.]|uniref:acetoacetate--CoA ligase n=1 Tax=Pusillimonas sp. TaxID=3040095 RepID=UPI002CABB3D5|nr:acetoacetate--CoA ligase [Pusillimonas sp.]HUH87526.1 acetoacetate--CoA ligase [Pusillimonas sp.]
MTIEQGEVLWQPTTPQINESRLAHFTQYLKDEHGKSFDDYAALWQWSVDELDEFWSAVWRFFNIQADGDPSTVLADTAMPGARWFPDVKLNYAEHVFRNADTNRPALLARSEGRDLREVSWQSLQEATGALAAYLRKAGVEPGDRVVSYMPNLPETVVAFLACASIGAIWSSCSPEMGVSVVVDRFRQIEPKVMFAVDSYRYNGKVHERDQVVSELLAELPSIEHVVHVGGPAQGPTPAWRGYVTWHEALSQPAPLHYERLPFDHPLWIVYSSGTTGMPKAMVHGHGGIVLTHLKTMQLQHDVRSGDRFMFLGSTGWIVWNLMVGGLLTGATVVLYDGNPTYPDARSLWKFINDHGVTHFGCGAAFLVQCKKDGVEPAREGDFKALRAINSTGSPLPLDAYEWVYKHVKRDLWLASISGGTDIASGFVACAPNLPVTAGEIQCRELGVAAYSFTDDGRPVVNEVGELVITKPMPSMPLFFWNDPGNKRYLESYFETFPGYWRHGDWIRFSPEGTAVIYGRSDTTINRYGIRMGTAEIYRVVEELPEVRDSMVVDLEYLGRPSYMPLFVVLAEGVELDQALIARIKEQIRTKASARHVPNEVIGVRQIPRTLSGKKMELPVRKLLLGASVQNVASPDAMANPESMAWYVDFAARLNATTAES